MSDYSHIQIRLSKHSLRGLEEISQHTGLTKAELCHIAVNEFIIKTELHSGGRNPMIDVKTNQGNVIGTQTNIDMGHSHSHKREGDEDHEKRHKHRE